jgi:ABC-type uncharacterized transport system substrate-binding protein
MRRRQFVTLLGGAAAVWPLVTSAQQPAMPVIGFLHSGSPDGWAWMVAAFREGLNDAGYAEGRNVTIEFHWAEGNYDRLPTLAADLVNRQVTVIVTPGSTPATLAAKAATATIPIVFAVGGDPVKFGFVSSFERPNINLTGVSLFTVKLEAKRVELLCELVPSATVVALLINPDTPVYESEKNEVQSAARLLGRQMLVLNARGESDIEVAFSRMEFVILCRRLVFFIVTAHRDPERVIRQRSLQGLGLVPRRAYPNVTLLFGRQDHRHCLRVDWFDNSIRRSRQEAVDKVRPRYGLGLGATVTFELGPDTHEGRQRSFVVQGEPDHVLFLGFQVGLWSPALPAAIRISRIGVAAQFNSL